MVLPLLSDRHKRSTKNRQCKGRGANNRQIHQQKEQESETIRKTISQRKTYTHHTQGATAKLKYTMKPYQPLHITLKQQNAIVSDHNGQNIVAGVQRWCTTTAMLHAKSKV